MKAKVWTMPISSEDMDREVLVAELERAQEKIQELESRSHSGTPSQFAFDFVFVICAYTVEYP